MSVGIGRDFTKGSSLCICEKIPYLLSSAYHIWRINNILTLILVKFFLF